MEAVLIQRQVIGGTVDAETGHMEAQLMQRQVIWRHS